MSSSCASYICRFGTNPSRQRRFAASASHSGGMQGEGRKSSARSSCKEGEIMFEQVAHDLINTADGTFLAMISGELVAGEQGRVEWSTLLSRVTVPTLVLAADPSAGGGMGEEQHRLVRRALPPAQIVDFPGRGHHIEAARPDAFVATVQGF